MALTCFKAYDIRGRLGIDLDENIACEQAVVQHKPRLLSDNGSRDISGDLEQQTTAFVDHYNTHCYNESLNNVTPADVYFGRDKDVLREREK